MKLADFGFAPDLRQSGVRAVYFKYGFIAPEILDPSATCTAAIDVWSLGAVAFCLRTGNPPFIVSKEVEEYGSGKRDFPSRVLGISTGFCIDFILGAMRPLPEKRLNIQQVLSHEWLNKRETLRTFKEE